MFNFTQPTFPAYVTPNDVVRKVETYLTKTIDFNRSLTDHTISYFDSMTDNQFTTYTKKLSTLNENIAEDAKKFVQAGTNKEVSGNRTKN